MISVMKRCPVCDYPMQYKYKRFRPASVDSPMGEILDFMTNDPKGGTYLAEVRPLQ